MTIQEVNILTCNSPYGKISLREVMLFNGLKKSHRLYLDDGLQWDSSDEYRYHQSLFAMPLLFLPKEGKKDILVLGGGDGLGVRELLKFEEEINSITVVDISKEMLFLAKNNEIFTELNKNSLNHPKVKVINDDAQNFVEKTNQKFDVIIHNLPSPVNEPDYFINNYYSKSFFKKIYLNLKSDGIFNMNASSPFLFPNVMHKILLNLSESTNQSVLPYLVDINSLGANSFLMLIKNNNPEYSVKRKDIPELFFSLSQIERFFFFHKDEYSILSEDFIEETDIAELVEYDLQHI